MTREVLPLAPVDLLRRRSTPPPESGDRRVDVSNQTQRDLVARGHVTGDRLKDGFNEDLSASLREGEAIPTLNLSPNAVPHKSKKLRLPPTSERGKTQVSLMAVRLLDT